MIGLVLMLTRLMINLMIGFMVIGFALAWWMVVAVFLVLPGDKRGIRRSMRSASRMASRALRRMVPIL